MGLCTPFRSFTKIQCETVSAEVGSTKLHRDDLEGEPGGGTELADAWQTSVTGVEERAEQGR